ncbi:hypothetical protein EZV73_13160 [Acidaminobacter sp. JC074]|uniref:Ig-like domain-containing protein n=1 Tax=Acidaminobacter sp. JC074 TaxID=2530199 RepID=UPI001F0DC578|nr:hypothetical protein [Acidaminobacter sp. JC074]MCH4888535.1 hypothetical protein [Acidaminobacter sp. JC074]
MTRNKNKIRKNLFITYFLILSLIFAASVYGLQVSDTEVFFQMNTSYVELTYGESFNFDVKVKGLSCCDVYWTLDDDRYLSVSSEGIVKVKDDIAGSGYGEKVVTLTATSVLGDYSDEAKILLIEPPKSAILPWSDRSFNTAVHIELNSNYVTLAVNETFDFNAKVKGLECCDLYWSLSDNSLLTVNDKGLVSFREDIDKAKINETIVTLTARSELGNYFDTASIEISQVPLGQVNVFSKHLMDKLRTIDTMEKFVVSKYDKHQRIYDKLRFIDIYEAPSVPTDFKYQRLYDKLRDIDINEAPYVPVNPKDQWLYNKLKEIDINEAPVVPVDIKDQRIYDKLRDIDINEAPYVPVSFYVKPLQEKLKVYDFL